MKNTKHIIAIATITAVFIVIFLAGEIEPVAALGNSTNTSMNITAGTPTVVQNLTIPKVFVGRQKMFNPGPLTLNTSNKYGVHYTNNHGDSGILLPIRQNYLFTGESMTYYAIVMDGAGASTINETHMYLLNASDVIDAGPCANVSDFNYTSDFTLKDYYNNPTAYDPATMRSFKCNLTVKDWIGEKWVYIGANDSTSNAGNSSRIEYIYFNPSISINVDGVINFGTVSPGTTSISNTVYLQNVDMGYNINNSGVVLDMYISSTPYFRDLNPASVCPTTAGLPHTALSYYATKGSYNSGYNNNDYPGLGESSKSLCSANVSVSGFTQLAATNSSNELSRMCRIINWDFDGSLLSQGSEMSLTFKADVPDPCSGTFTNGQFYFIGEVI